MRRVLWHNFCNLISQSNQPIFLCWGERFQCTLELELDSNAQKLTFIWLWILVFHIQILSCEGIQMWKFITSLSFILGVSSNNLKNFNFQSEKLLEKQWKHFQYTFDNPDFTDTFGYMNTFKKLIIILNSVCSWFRKTLLTPYLT